MGKRMETLVKEVDENKFYPLAEGAELVKKTAKAKFDETVELHIKLGIDPKQSDQQVRGTIALPHGTEAQVRPRSGLALKHGITCLNAPGTIDADYRGEIGVILINHGTEPFTVNRGMRVAQLVIAEVRRAAWREVEDLDESARGDGGFGSTGLASGTDGEREIG